MSAETCAYLNTDFMSLVEYLTNKYSLNPKEVLEVGNKDENYVDIDIDNQKNIYSDQTIWDKSQHSYHGFASIYTGNLWRALFILDASLNDDEDVKGFKPLWDEDKGCLYVSLAQDGTSVDIIKDLAYEFGGLIDEDDCDDEPYYYVSSARDNVKSNH